MPDELVGYYERELEFLRQMGAEFAQKHGKIARRLSLKPDRCEDPHVERLLEGFALLTARIHKKLDDELPQITEALLRVLYPHYIRPIPPMSVVEIHADPEQGKLATGLSIPRGATLSSRPIEGIPCKFRTCYETTMWPVAVTSAQWGSPDRMDPPINAPQAAAACRLELTCSADVRFDQLGMESLRMYLTGQSSTVLALYELLFNNTVEILVRDPENRTRTPLRLPVSMLQPMGFREEESLLPYPRRSFNGYRLLQEYFSFPEKFLFIELGGLQQLAGAGFGQKAEINFLISPFERADRQQILELGVNASTFRLNCTPIVNLFQQTAEPIRLDQTKWQYQVTPDARRRRGMEIFSVDQVLAANAASDEVTYYEPFYSIRHQAEGEQTKAFWHAERTYSDVDGGSEIDLSLLDLSARPSYPNVDTLTVRCTCTNRNLPTLLPFGADSGDFELEGAALIKKIVTLHKFTPSYRPRKGKEFHWRLISHLSLNYLSLVQEGREALQEILRIYDFSDGPYNERQIDGITGLESRRHFARVISEHGIHFVRGTRVDLEIDENQFAGDGAFLFAQVLENFLGLYVSMNSFSQLVVRTKQRKGILKEWAPRTGNRILL